MYTESTEPVWCNLIKPNVQSVQDQSHALYDKKNSEAQVVKYIVLLQFALQ